MTARSEALERLRRLPDTVEPDRGYAVEAFRPEDGEGVAALFYRVYGEGYPMDMYYIPDAIRLAVVRGELHPVVARLGGGEVVGFAALHASSAPFAGLLEFGLGMVHPAYRGSLILFHLFNAVTARMRELSEVEAVFGEAVCDTIITQRVSALFGMREVALELDLMPGTGEGRISCLAMFQSLRDRRRRLYCPPRYAAFLGRIVADAGLDREMLALDASAPPARTTRLETRCFPGAGLLRGNVFHLAADGPEALVRAEAEAMAAGCRIFQWFLNLGEPSAAAAATWLRQSGYASGGLIPRWFDDDALLMQKHLDDPDPSRIHLYSDAARSLLALILADRDRSA